MLLVARSTNLINFCDEGNNPLHALLLFGTATPPVNPLPGSIDPSLLAGVMIAGLGLGGQFRGCRERLIPLHFGSGEIKWTGMMQGRLSRLTSRKTYFVG
jgi:hypothetical protein